jgi:hypothetical protein
MGSIFASSRPGGLGSTIAACALLAGVAHGCGRADDGQREVRAPGDVPWLAACAEDADCAEGQCLCGLCSTPCVEGVCDGEGPPNAQCLEPEHWLSAALCAGRSDSALCMTGCDSSGPCEAGFDCLDGFCVSSPAATVAREQELIPIGPLCERDRVVWRSLLLELPEQVEALRGCERIEGNLRVDADAISDLSALGSLRSVRGSLDILARSPATAADAVPFDLSGLERVESVGRLRLASVALSTLAPLSSLRAIEGPSDSGLYLAEVSELTSLDGLRRLERVKRIEFSDVPGLRSLRGLESLREVEALDVRGMPLEELAAPGQFVLTGSLNLEWTSLVTLQGLAESSRPSSIRLGNNRLLVSLDGLRVAEALEELWLEGNTALEEIRALVGVREVNGPLVLSGSPLRSLEGLDALERVEGLTLSGTAITDLRGLGRLENVDGVDIRENLALVTLAGLAPSVSIGWMSVAANPSLTQLSLGNATIDALLVFECPIPDLSGLEAVTLNRQLTVEGVPNLTSLAGFRPGPAGLSELTLGRCPRLTDLGALAGLSALDWLAIHECGPASLDALGSLRRLGALALAANPNLTNVQALASLEKLGSIAVSQNPSLATLPSFAAAVDGSDPASCRDDCGFSLVLDGNAALQQGPGFPALARAAYVSIGGNPNLAGMGSFAALRSVFRLQVEGNPALGVLGLTNVQSASSIIVRGNAALPESELEALRAAGASELRIASNGAGPDRLDPCPWVLDGVCDEVFEACAAGTDAPDCVGYEPLAWGLAGSLAP